MLRLSLRARCNLACPYCLTDGQEPEGLLALEQRVAVVAARVARGVSTLRLTGGEPWEPSMTSRQCKSLTAAAHIATSA